MSIPAPITVPEQSNALEMTNVSRRFDEHAGVFELNLHVPRGSIVGLIGPSGCGKTTTVRLALGVYRPDEGNLKVMGESSSRLSTRTRESIGYLPQQFVLYPNLSVIENVRFAASLYGIGPLQRGKQVQSALEFVELYTARNTLAGKISGGMQRRLALACALVHNPILLFADEPTAGIDPVLRAKIWEQFRQLRDQGRTLIITTQYVGEAAYCDLVGVMRQGRLLHLDTPDNLRARALGGAVLRLWVDPAQRIDAAKWLRLQPEFAEVRLAHEDKELLFIYVDDAAQRLPDVVRLFDEHPEIKINKIEEYQPSFDEVFVRLMEDAR
jgi:ABC-2 type transport system ATP-binding protein